MPRPSCITAPLLAEVSKRRADGEAWKPILGDLRKRGLPYGRTTWFRALPDVPEQQPAGQAEETRCTAG